jgi:hypothetical protein
MALALGDASFFRGITPESKLCARLSAFRVIGIYGLMRPSNWPGSLRSRDIADGCSLRRAMS